MDGLCGATMSAFYNEIDPQAAAWLRELIKQGHIAPGDVDERSIEDIKPHELEKYTQCHFFAGIGVWSHALRGAGFTDDQPIWTGSCPCQPFSAAGKGAGVDDERHLWPAFHWLIKQCQPSIVLGEQVAHKAGAAWFDVVSTDLEGEDYSCGKVVFPACGVGAPHLRQRQYWVASHPGWKRVKFAFECTECEYCGEAFCQECLDHYADCGCYGPTQDDCEYIERDGDLYARRVGDTKCAGLEGHDGSETSSKKSRWVETAADRPSPTAGICNGFWGDFHLAEGNGYIKPVQPGTFPLANGSPERVGRLRGYGNAIVAPQAQAFCEVVKEIITNH